MPGGQGAQVLWAEDLLEHGHQLGELVPGGHRIPGLPGPACELVPGDLGVPVLRPEDPFPCISYSPREISGCSVTAAPAEVTGHFLHPAGVIGKSRLYERPHRREYRPGLGQDGIVRDCGLDQGSDLISLGLSRFGSVLRRSELLAELFDLPPEPPQKRRKVVETVRWGGGRSSMV
jgi:hypothetical protein